MLARREGVDVDFVHSNVYDAVTALGDERFDVVYTGKGALCYLPDLDRWASEVAGLLRPGGLLYLVEFHPLLASLSLSPAPGNGPEPLLRHDYLEGRGVIEKSATSTYTDGPPLRGAARLRMDARHRGGRHRARARRAEDRPRGPLADRATQRAVRLPLAPGGRDPRPGRSENLVRRG